MFSNNERKVQEEKIREHFNKLFPQYTPDGKLVYTIDVGAKRTEWPILDFLLGTKTKVFLKIYIPVYKGLENHFCSNKRSFFYRAIEYHCKRSLRLREFYSHHSFSFIRADYSTGEDEIHVARREEAEPWFDYEHAPTIVIEDFPLYSCPSRFQNTLTELRIAGCSFQRPGFFSFLALPIIEIVKSSTLKVIWLTFEDYWSTEPLKVLFGFRKGVLQRDPAAAFELMTFDDNEEEEAKDLICLFIPFCNLSSISVGKTRSRIKNSKVFHHFRMNTRVRIWRETYEP